VERVLLFEGEDAGFQEKWDRKDEELQARLVAARVASLASKFQGDPRSIVAVVAELAWPGIAGTSRC